MFRWKVTLFDLDGRTLVGEWSACVCLPIRCHWYRSWSIGMAIDDDRQWWYRVDADFIHHKSGYLRKKSLLYCCNTLDWCWKVQFLIWTLFEHDPNMIFVVLEKFNCLLALMVICFDYCLFLILFTSLTIDSSVKLNLHWWNDASKQVISFNWILWIMFDFFKHFKMDFYQS